ncbi:hypothetical protein B0T26DRAFT_352050 [Lasiosphaeria miniovina]|uniref:Uncharacterized protein n=1 Tax=Lasiosphaeria miniovina TaxID=1954250 RepID=A0AA40ABV1_9PEZI|nr:uncharacterized protein B0T26DRAFT_352050 [Lasiosphaeria miniovina]KAK0713024.1 hypothetical protein B0T26DRAFT_352050 [Lasiosphaeria miniovina]
MAKVGKGTEREDASASHLCKLWSPIPGSSVGIWMTGRQPYTSKVKLRWGKNGGGIDHPNALPLDCRGHAEWLARLYPPRSTRYIDRNDYCYYINRHLPLLRHPESVDGQIDRHRGELVLSACTYNRLDSPCFLEKPSVVDVNHRQDRWTHEPRADIGRSPRRLAAIPHLFSGEAADAAARKHPPHSTSHFSLLLLTSYFSPPTPAPPCHWALGLPYGRPKRLETRHCSTACCQ